MRWRLASPLVAWGVAGVVVSTLGILAGRPGVAVVGLPLLITMAWATSRPIILPPAPRLRGHDQAAGSGRLRAAIDVDPGPDPVLVGIRVSAPGHRPAEALIRSRVADPDHTDPRTVGVSLGSVRTGRRELFRLDHRFTSPDGLLCTEAQTAPSLTVTVLPGLRPLGELPLPFRLHGLTGPHRSRRVGDEAELRDVAQFSPGDRTRRIDWRVTSRLNTGPPVGPESRNRITQLYVRRSFASADATVMLVIDSRDQVGARVLTWADATALREDEATSLDIARTAAAALADRYLAGGDRVGLEDLGRFRRPVPPAGGRQQQRRLVQRLALAEPEGEPTPRRRVPRLPSGCLILVLSTFLDDDPADMALAWHGAGHRVLAVDTLPALNLTGATPRLMAAFRLVAMEREDRMANLRRAGISCFGWAADPASDPAVALTRVARTRERP